LLRLFLIPHFITVAIIATIKMVKKKTNIQKVIFTYFCSLAHLSTSFNCDNNGFQMAHVAVQVFVIGFIFTDSQSACEVPCKVSIQLLQILIAFET
jgi:hypothetical protein